MITIAEHAALGQATGVFAPEKLDLKTIFEGDNLKKMIDSWTGKLLDKKAGYESKVPDVTILPSGAPAGGEKSIAVTGEKTWKDYLPYIALGGGALLLALVLVKKKILSF